MYPVCVDQADGIRINRAATTPGSFAPFTTLSTKFKTLTAGGSSSKEAQPGATTTKTATEQPHITF